MIARGSKDESIYKLRHKNIGRLQYLSTSPITWGRGGYLHQE